MQQTISHPQDISLSQTDTLEPEFLSKMSAFYNSQRPKIYANKDSNAAIFAFTNRITIYNNDGTYKYGQGFNPQTYLCHNPFNAADESCTGVINIYSKCIRASARPFLEFILDENGVFGEATSKLHVIRDKDKDDYPVGTIVTKMDDMPIQIYSSFQITGRLLTGWGLDLVWHRLVNAGLSPEAALCLTTLYTWHATGVVVHDTNIDGRFGIDPSHQLDNNGPFKLDQPFTNNGSAFSPRRVMDHDPETSRRSITQGAKPNPCNLIWNENGLHAKRNGFNFYKKDAENSIIFKTIKTSGKFTSDEVSKIEKDMYDAREQVII